MKIINAILMVGFVGVIFLAVNTSLDLLLQGSTLAIVGGSMGLLFATIIVYSLYQSSKTTYEEPR
ncbi:hypothetical protein [Natrinema versiforme]|uniref:Uncharacterized protein n=1 Tax=Natrinema versiforme TaxID=88724 RepID=A0A4V1G029_9EURY|nr:hypothetical protein [Natrinema versiforme]QCS43906.1 hypothetical protein FEJ81_16700 [Natrinema versiforme]